MSEIPVYMTCTLLVHVLVPVLSIYNYVVFKTIYLYEEELKEFENGGYMYT